MKKKQNSDDTHAKFRKIAEKKLQTETESHDPSTPQEVKYLRHELRVHQIELEMQNEELRTTQLELNDAREKYFDLFDFAPVGYFTISEKGFIVEMNQTAATMFGVEKYQLMNKSFSLLILKADQDIFYLRWKKLIETEEKQQFDLQMNGKKGAIFWGHIVSVRSVDSDGSFTCRVAVTDITESKKAEETLRESERYLKETQTIARLGSYILDIPAGIWQSSTILNDIFGIGSDYPRSIQGWVSIIHPDWQKMMVDYFTNEVIGNKIKFDKEYKIVRQIDHEERWVHGLGTLQFDEQGNLIKMIGTISDITARKHSEDEITRLNESLEQKVIERTSQLEASNKELEAFSYSVSHDLRAPLRAIDGFSKALLEDYHALFDENATDYIRRVRSATRRMGELIDDMLKLSRLSRRELSRQDINLTTIAQSIVNELQRNDPNRKTQIHIAPEMIANADIQLMKVALENLIGNAWKFSSKKSHARIEVNRMLKDDKIVYYVRDNGVGFDMAYANKLFGAFQRLHTKTEFEGTGIGLANVQRIIRRHGGEIWAEAEVDKGATFFFTI